MLDLNLGISMFNEEEASSSTSTSAGGFISFGILKREDHVELHPPPPPESDLAGGMEWLNLSSMQQEVVVNKKKKKSRRGPKSRSSHYRGVTFYRRTGRWESHIWDCGKQVYLGGFDTAYTAARAYDRAAIKFRGLQADINFLVDDYKQDIEKVKNLSKEELVQSLRRESASLARRGSKHKDFTPTKCTNMKNDLELSLKISSSSENIKRKTTDYYMDMNRSLTSLYGKPLLKTVVASTGFPFIAMINSSSLSTCFDP